MDHALEVVNQPHIRLHIGLEVLLDFVDLHFEGLFPVGVYIFGVEHCVVLMSLVLDLLHLYEQLREVYKDDIADVVLVAENSLIIALTKRTEQVDELVVFVAL